MERVTYSTGTTLTIPGMPKMKSTSWMAKAPYSFVDQSGIDDNCRNCGMQDIAFEMVRNMFMCRQCREPIMMKRFWIERCRPSPPPWSDSPRKMEFWKNAPGTDVR